MDMGAVFTKAIRWLVHLQHWYFKICYRLLPARQSLWAHEELDTLYDNYGWRNVFKRSQLWGWVRALLQVGIIFYVWIILFQLNASIFGLSAFTTVERIISFIVVSFVGHPDTVEFITFFSLLMLLIMMSPARRASQGKEGSDEEDVEEPTGLQNTFTAMLDPHILKDLPKHAFAEEVRFRLGSEQWSLPNKLRVSLLFGFLHLAMIVIPIGIALALALTGIVYVIEYEWVLRKTGRWQDALLAAANLHLMYNVCAVLLFFGLLTYFFGYVWYWILVG